MSSNNVSSMCTIKPDEFEGGLDARTSRDESSIFYSVRMLCSLGASCTSVCTCSGKAVLVRPTQLVAARNLSAAAPQRNTREQVRDIQCSCMWECSDDNGSDYGGCFCSSRLLQHPARHRQRHAVVYVYWANVSVSRRSAGGCC